jgi:hypothetical protein
VNDLRARLRSAVQYDWGLVYLIVTILLVWALYYGLWALWYGLPTPWGVFHLDLFPPAIRKAD